MGCGKTGKSVTKRLVTTTTDEIFEPFTDWMLGIGVDYVRMVIKRKNVQVAGGAPTINFKPAMQVAQVRPDDALAYVDIAGIGPYAGAGESQTSEQNIATTTAANFWVRFGVSYYLGGTTPTSGQADVEAQVSYTACGSMVGSMTQELQVYNTTSNSFVAISGWVPAVDADKVVAAFVITNIGSNFQCQLAYRTAATSIQATSVWNLIGTVQNANGETATTELALSLSGQMFVQFGLAFSQSAAGAAPGRASVSTAVAVRKT